MKARGLFWLRRNPGVADRIPKEVDTSEHLLCIAATVQDKVRNNLIAWRCGNRLGNSIIVAWRSWLNLIPCAHDNLHYKFCVCGLSHAI